ncbi:MAG: tail fiber domain-containing protein [Bacteroidia bacterium]|nr:tail fiber domain-containing protein [Bacteroidia bacterium]
MKKIFAFFLIGLASTSWSQGLLNGLQGCYPMNCDGFANNAATGSSYDGTIYGNVTCTSGHQGTSNTAYQFGGTFSDHVDLQTTSALKPTTEVTFSGWYKITSDQSQSLYTLVYAKSGYSGSPYVPAWELRIESYGGSRYFGSCRLSSFCNSSVPISLNTWYHVVVYWNSSRGRIWVNNVKDSLVFSSGAISYDASAPIILGSNNTTNWTSKFQGSMDNIRFYDRALNSAEITDLYNNDPACNSTGANFIPPPPTGNYCSANTSYPLAADYQVPMATYNYNFTNPSSSGAKVSIGYTGCTGGSARFNVTDDNLGSGIFSHCSTGGANNIAIRGEAGDGTSTTETNIFGVLGEANLSGGNTSGIAAGVAGFCGPMASGSMPPGELIGVYGNSMGAGGRWAAYFDGDAKFNGQVWGSQFMWSSDKRFKNNIKTLEDVSSKLKKISGYTYSFKTEEFKKNNFPKTEQIGFLAQELKEQFPQLVSEDSKGYLGVNYVGFIPVLLRAHQEQQDLLEAQQQQINEMKEQLKALTGTPSTSKAENLSVTLGDKKAIVLNQNVPNPFAETTVITYDIPTDFTKAEIVFSTGDGIVMKSVSITKKGPGSLTVYANDLTHGSYIYSLVVDGRSIDSKRLIKE